MGNSAVAQESPASENVAKVPLRQIALVALGGNVASHFGTVSETMRLACQRLASDSVTVELVSRYFMTPCFPIGAGPDYINATAILSTTLSPAGLLAVLHQTEAEMGRQRLQRWGNRTLDLDLLAYGDIVSPSTDGYRLWHDLAPDARTRLCSGAFAGYRARLVPPGSGAYCPADGRCPARHRGWRRSAAGVTGRDPVLHLRNRGKSRLVKRPRLA
jgi:2-amino-4-hydroxy-6-hydroxymethyldihydropteridine diphosphokinase